MISHLTIHYQQDIEMATKMDEICSNLLSTNRMAFRSDD